MALIAFRNKCLNNYQALLHVKLNAKTSKKICGYFGASLSGYNSQVLEGMCPGLGQ
jgi:hypothetical protein